MHGTQTLQHLNSEATERDAIANRDKSKYGLAKYAGQTFVSLAEFDTMADQNEAAINWTNRIGGYTVRFFNPERK